MSLPYFPMYPTDFEADTSHLTLAEDGAYNRLLRLMWMTPGCSLPDDDVWILRRMRCADDGEKQLVMDVVDEFFTRSKGRVRNARLAKEFAKSDVAHKKRVSAGSKGGKAKALKTNNSEPINAKAMPKQPEPEPEPYIREDTNVSSSDLPPAIDEISEAVLHFNATAEKVGWPKMQKMSQPRRTALLGRLRDVGGLDGWREAIDRAALAPHLIGQNNRGWMASFDWLTKPANFTKLMEGNYDPRNPGISGTTTANGGRRGPHDNLMAGFAEVANSGRG